MDPKDEIIDELRRKVSYFEARCLELKEQRTEYIKGIQHQGDLYKKAIEERDGAVKNRDVALHQVEALKRQVADFEQHASNNSKEIQLLRELHNRALVERDRALSELTETKQRCLELLKERDTAIRQRDEALKHQLTGFEAAKQLAIDFKKERDEARTQAKGLLEVCDEAYTDLYRAAKEHDVALAELSETKQRCLELLKERDEAIKNRDAAKAKLAETKQRCLDLRVRDAALAELSQTNLELQAERDQALKERNQAVNDRNTVLMTCDELRTKLKQADKKNNELWGTIWSMRDLLSNIKSKIIKMEAQQ